MFETQFPSVYTYNITNHELTSASWFQCTVMHCPSIATGAVAALRRTWVAAFLPNLRQGRLGNAKMPWISMVILDVVTTCSHKTYHFVGGIPHVNTRSHTISPVKWEAQNKNGTSTCGIFFQECHAHRWLPTLKLVCWHCCTWKSAREKEMSKVCR